MFLIYYSSYQKSTIKCVFFVNNVMIWTEWDPLKEIIVGRVYDPNDIAHIEDVEFRNGLQRIFEESEEDFFDLADEVEETEVLLMRQQQQSKEDEK